MNRRGLWSGALFAGFVLLALPVSARADSVSKTSPPTTTPASGGTTTPPLGSGADGSVIESWALAPDGFSRPNLSYSADPDGTVNDSVILANYGDVTMNFRVYATDAFNNDQGKFDILPGDKKPVDVGTWVTLPQENFTVPPHKQYKIPIVIHVPKGATFGDHSGAIVASNLTPSTDANGGTVMLDRRTGTRLYIRVKGKLNPHLTVSNVQTDYHHAKNPLSGSATVTYRINNVGNVRLSGTDAVSISGPFGLGRTTLRLADIPELLPGQHFDVHAEVADVPALGLDFTTTKIVAKGAADVTDVKIDEGTDTTFAPPITFLLVLLIIVLAVLVRRALRRRRAAAAVVSGPKPTQRAREPERV